MRSNISHSSSLDSLLGGASQPESDSSPMAALMALAMMGSILRPPQTSEAAPTATPITDVNPELKELFATRQVTTHKLANALLKGPDLEVTTCILRALKPKAV